MNPETLGKAVRLLHEASGNVVDGMKAPMEITQIQQQEIKTLKSAVESLNERVWSLEHTREVSGLD